MTRPYIGHVDTLLDAHNTGRKMWVFCRNCGYAKLILPWAIIRDSKAREFVRLTDLAPKFACTKCSHHVAQLMIADGLAHGYNSAGRR